jgi:four helix bundle protein
MFGVDRFEDLLTWQLMHEVNVEVWTIAARPPLESNVKFRGQLTDAADSAVRNVAEGFARYNPGDFARFLDVSRASATEVRSCLKTARIAGYISPAEFTRIDGLARRGLQALARFQRYLRTTEEARRNAKRARYSRSKAAAARNDSNDSND